MIKKNKGKDRGDLFINGINNGNEDVEEELNLSNWDDLPLYFKDYGLAKVKLYRSNASTTSGGTVKSGDFHLYLEDVEGYTYIQLELEDISVINFYLEHIARFLAGEPNLEKDSKVYSIPKELPNKADLIIGVTQSQKLLLILKNESNIVKVEMPLKDVIYLSTVLKVIFEEAYKEFTKLRLDLWSNVKPKVSKNLKWEDTMYG